MCEPSIREILHQFRAQPNDLARREYLVDLLPELSEPDFSFAKQMLATVDAELGLYNEALSDFPFDGRETIRNPIPWADQQFTGPSYNIKSYVYGSGDIIAADASGAIAKMAATRRIVLVNEAHHDAHTRVLTLELLPRLRALGYNYFAAEALTEDGRALMRRGYPIKSSGTEYLHEPLYGEIVREAVRLGYTIVNYDLSGADTDREEEQAKALYQKVFSKDPHARLFAQVGYAHIDKEKGRLGLYTPMAEQLQKMTGIPVLSIDQTQLRDVMPPSNVGPYHQLIEVFHPTKPVVLQFHGDHIWSSDPARFDVSVVLPQIKNDGRPSWLSLDNTRAPWPISTALCRDIVPCAVDAHYVSEPDTAIPADIYTFLTKASSSYLYLRPGAYRLLAWDSKGETLANQIIQVPVAGLQKAGQNP